MAGRPAPLAEDATAVAEGAALSTVPVPVAVAAPLPVLGVPHLAATAMIAVR